MTEIIFQSKADANKFYSYMLKVFHDKMENILLFEDPHIVRISAGSVSINFLESIKKALFEFIIKIKRDDWFRNILVDHYYYTDPEEVQQILEIFHSILEGRREDLSVFLRGKSEMPKIREAIDQIFFEDVPFSFDSFLKFRLRPYLEVLENYVEIAIDEYKMEQEYQMFVHMLREFLAERNPKMESLHLTFGEEITFYSDDFREIKRGELTKMIDRKLLANHPVYIDSASIAPLLSLAPAAIYLYTDKQDDPLVRTIKNIFEERVHIKTREDFFRADGPPKACND